MKSYRPWDPDQSFLFPPAPRDWLPEGHLVFFVLDLVAGLDLSEIEGVIHAKDARGNRPHDPRMMSALVLYGYCVGVTSSRRLERATHEDVAFRVLSGDQHPDHTAISTFRKQHLHALSGLFVQVLRLCQQAKLVKLGHVALDGTKLRANASKHKAMSHARMMKSEQELMAEVEAMLQRAEEIDAAEDELYGKDKRGDELPEELRRRESRLKKLAEARQALEAEAAKRHAKEKRELAEKAQKKAAGAKGKAQAKAEERADDALFAAECSIETALELAAERAETTRRETQALEQRADTPAERKLVTQARQTQERAERDLERTRIELSSSADSHAQSELPEHCIVIDAEGNPMPRAQRNFTDPDSRILKDGGGYMQGYNCQAVVDEAHQIIIAAGASNQAPDVEYLKPMLEAAVTNCGATPAVFTADAGYWSDENARFCEGLGTDAYIATGRQKHGVHASGDPVSRGHRSELRSQMRDKLQTEDGKARYARRKAVAEPPFGQIKEVRGIRRFLLRGMEQVRDEWSLICISHNILKLFRAQAT
ncbi:MAG: transposase [Planctomycetes bacterium]|nr:transposase [Planctomycetota bacterium]MCB9915609.1 transposase [Planctomycetota bacterium]